jgi:hypothetical protein
LHNLFHGLIISLSIITQEVFCKRIQYIHKVWIIHIWQSTTTKRILLWSFAILIGLILLLLLLLLFFIFGNLFEVFKHLVASEKKGVFGIWIILLDITHAFHHLLEELLGLCHLVFVHWHFAEIYITC